MQVVSFVLCLAVGSCVAKDTLEWWRTASLYQIYPLSFQDSNGDGTGDIPGITARADYFKELDINAVWLSPIYKSPMADLGYDIANFREIDPLYGTIDDLKALMDKLHSLDIKLLLDFVPNHTSDEHEWFQKSVKKEEPYTDYYVWVDGKTDPATGQRVPPNNWQNAFGDPAWEWNEQRQQFYLHQFLIKQPDLNFRNARVKEEIYDVMKYWMDIGVDGLRVDAIPSIYEDEQLRDNPIVDGNVGIALTQNLPETYDLVHNWAQFVFDYDQKDGVDRALFLESNSELNFTLAYYGTGNESLMQPFNFNLVKGGGPNAGAEEYRDLITSWLDNMPAGAPANWVIGNHDRTRASDHHGANKVDAMNLLSGVLQGSKVTFYGEEIGMHGFFVPYNQTVDPPAKALGPDRYQEISRDAIRSPMLWDDSDSAGFSTNSSTWVPISPDYRELNVAKQKEARTSHLKVYKAMAKERKDPVLLRGDTDVLVPNNKTLLLS